MGGVGHQRERDGLSAFFDTANQRFERIQRKIVVKFLRGSLGTRKAVEGGRRGRRLDGDRRGDDRGGLGGGDISAQGSGLSEREVGSGTGRRW